MNLPVSKVSHLLKDISMALFENYIKTWYEHMNTDFIETPRMTILECMVVACLVLLETDDCLLSYLYLFTFLSAVY